MKISLVLLVFFGLCLAVALAHRGHSHGHGGHSHSHGHHHHDHAHSHSHSHSHSHHHSHDHSGHSHSHDDDHSGHSHDHSHDAAPESTNDDQRFVHDDQPFVHEDQPFVHEDLPIIYSDDNSDILIQRVPYDPDEESDIAHEHHEYHEYQYAVPIENTVNVMASTDLPVLNQEGPGNGLGNGINWVPLEHAFKIAHDENRYTIVIIHKKACRASMQFAASASSNPEFERLSKAFVMVNVLDTEEPLDPKFHPDGSYFPRVLFFDTEGNLVTNLIRYMGDRQIVYYYPEFSSLEGTMKMALEAAPFTMEIAELLGPNAIGA